MYSRSDVWRANKVYGPVHTVREEEGSLERMDVAGTKSKVNETNSSPSRRRLGQAFAQTSVMIFLAVGTV